MPKFKAYVKVPADSKSSLKRIVTKTISADNSAEALQLLRGQYGSQNVNIASQIIEKKPRKIEQSKVAATQKKTATSVSKIKKSYKRNNSSNLKSTSNSSSVIDSLAKTSVGEPIFIFIGIIIIGWVVSAIIGSPTIFYIFIVIAFVFIIKKIIDLFRYIYSFFKTLFS